MGFPSYADSERHTGKQVPYLGLDSRKHWQETLGSETGKGRKPVGGEFSSISPVGKWR